jgi:hypothetical protein
MCIYMKQVKIPFYNINILLRFCHTLSFKRNLCVVCSSGFFCHSEGISALRVRRIFIFTKATMMPY